MKMLKKYFKIPLLVVFFFGFASTLSAELHPFRRYVELSVDAQAGISNNALTVNEIMVKKLVIDLKKIGDSLSDSDLVLNSNISSKVALSVNTKKFRISLFNNLEGTFNSSISGSIFEILSKGIKIPDQKTFDLGINGELYDELGVSVFANIAGMGFTLTPALYFPLLYVPDVPGKLNYSIDKEGLSAKMAAEFNIYSAIDLDNISSPEIKINEMIKNAGFSMGFGFEKNLFGILDLGGYLSIPFSAGKLDYKRTQTFSVDVAVDNILDKVVNDGGSSSSSTSNTSTSEKISTEYYKPIKFGVEAAFRPFGYWFTVSGLLGCGIRDPYFSETRSVFVEYDVGATVSLFKILDATLSSGYKNKIFVQTVGISLNARVLQLDAKLIFQSASFSKSFTGAGAGAYVGVKIGF